MTDAIGIDVGATKIAIGIVDTTTGKILHKKVVATPKGSGLGVEFIYELAAIVHDMERLPIGIGICELVDKHGTIASQTKFKWTNADLQRAFDFAPSLVFEQDVRAAAEAEGLFGAGVGVDNWIYVNVGTGIGTVLMSGAKPYMGNSGLGQAFGMSPASMVFDRTYPSIEDLTSSRGLVNTAKAHSFDVESLQDVIATAPHLLAEGGRILGRATASVANMLDPHTIVLGGGVVMASSVYCAAFAQEFRAAAWFSYAYEAHIQLAKLGSDSGLVGAALAGARVA